MVDFRVFGDSNAAVLDYGQPQWRSKQRPLTNTIFATETTKFEPGLRCKLDRIKTIYAIHDEQIIDDRNFKRPDST